MNNDEIKRRLLKIERNVPDFAVILSGKKSRKVDGLYKPESKEIIIHNRNFTSDNELMYTAIHEFAHHIQFSKATKPITAKCHTADFWNIFHTILGKAEEIQEYENVFVTKDEFVRLTKMIREEFLEKNGVIMKEFGKILIKAKELCDKYRASFFDYIERVLSLPRSSARTLMKAYSYNVNPEIGFDNMKVVARISDDEKRKEAEQAILQGTSPYIIKSDFLDPKRESSSQIEALKQEKDSLEKRIQALKGKLALIQKRIAEFEKS
jgi:hypothetical protein